ncbi:MAG: phosphotransferase [Lachnospiraceae bacterium]|nr:phosphotransferase [Lachnospiraceae bacterium]
MNNESFFKAIKNHFPASEYKNWRKLSSTRNTVYSADINGKKHIVKFYNKKEYNTMNIEYNSIMHSTGPLNVTETPLDEIIINDTEYCYKIYSYIEGTPLSFTYDDFYELGFSIGTLQKQWVNKPKPDWLPYLTLNELIDKPLLSLKAVLNEAMYNVVYNYSTRVKSLLKDSCNPENLGFCHGDSHLLNSVKTTDYGVVLFDYEDSCYSFPVYDLATAIWGTFSSECDEDVWHGAAAGYLEGLSPYTQELSLLPYLIFARHLWWMGLHADNMNKWQLYRDYNVFFNSSYELLVTIATDLCCL